jgi:hypothetical protein
MKDFSMSRNSFLKFLSELESLHSDDADMITLYHPQGSSERLEELPEEMGIYVKKILKRHPLGIVALGWQKGNVKILIFPPFPVTEEFKQDNKFMTEQLREIFGKELKIGVILLNLGEYAIGIFEGGKLIDSKVGKRYLRGKHGKGGMSQMRYLRLRRMHTGIFFKEFEGVLREKIERHLGSLDYIIYGGAPVTIHSFQKGEGFVRKLNQKTLDRILEAREISKKALEEIMLEVWKTRIVDFNQ